ncbi:MAG: hypothetical protein AB7O44_20800 [Hyphomicrobiaceae bacterium]
MHADASGDEYRRMSGRTSLADALHQSGDVVAAEQLFREAEAIQAKRQPDLDRLYSVQGYKYCNHLLGRGAGAEVKRRAAYALEAANQRGLSWLIHALDTLSLGRAAHVLGDRTNARHHFDDAIEGLRKAGTEHHLPRGLLARAAFRRGTGDLGGAHQDLTEAHEIALRGGMRLHLTDICLEWGRLQLAHLATNSTAEAEHVLQAADQRWIAAANLIKETGYHRRVGELAALREAIDRVRTGVSAGALPTGIDVC